jgi:hypothetical protein
MTPVANIATSFAGVVDTGGKVLTIPAANLPPVAIYKLTLLPKGVHTK